MNRWARLALFSLIGLVISSIGLSMVNKTPANTQSAPGMAMRQANPMPPGGMAMMNNMTPMQPSGMNMMIPMGGMASMQPNGMVMGSMPPNSMVMGMPSMPPNSIVYVGIPVIMQPGNMAIGAGMTGGAASSGGGMSAGGGGMSMM